MARVRPRLAPRSWCLAVAVAALAAAPIAAQTARTQERDIFVTVLNQAGEPVTGLDADAFVIREDGRQREVLRVRRATDPIDLAVLLDNSQAAGGAMLDLRRGLEAFAGRLKGAANLSVVTVADRPTVSQDYTSDAGAIQQAIGRLFATPGSGATVLEALNETLRDLKKREAERAAILVVWLGGPEFSNLGHQSLLQDLKAGGAQLQVVTVGSGLPPDVGTTEGRHREIVFDQGTRDTGGRRRNVLSSMGLTEALEKLAHELLNQYRVTYARPDALIPPEEMTVSVRPAGLTASGTPARVIRKAPGRP